MATAALGVLVLLALGVGGMPASGNEPEGGDGITLDVVPSDDLPGSSVVTVTGQGFFSEGSIPAQVSVRQCVPSLEACGPTTMFTTDGNASFSGPFVVVRMLSLSDTTVDCTEVVCEVWAEGLSFASHHLTFSTLAPTTTTSTLKPPVTTTTTARVFPTTVTTRPAPTTTIDRRPQPGVTIPPTTRPGTPSTTIQLSTTSSSTSTTSTTVPPASSDLDGPSLIAVTPKNEPSGPPGGGLRVSGAGYTCPTVYFFFDGVRVGSGTPDGAGRVSKSGLSVPGDAGNGTHEVTASCDPSGDTVEQASFFEVLPVSVHRPAFVRRCRCRARST